MIYHHILLLCLTWPYVKGTGSGESQNEAVFDQLATASENVGTIKSSEQNPKDLRDQLIPSLIDTTIHYENSNGFVPMTSPSTQSQDKHQHVSFTTSSSKKNENSYEKKENNNSTNKVQEVNKLEDDPAYSAEVRILLNLPQSGTNRRSFESQDTENNFELLKVNNNTPAIANYQDFYNKLRNNNENDDEKNNKNAVKTKVKDKGKRAENHLGNYGTDINRYSNRNSYAQYYHHGMTEDPKKSTHEQGKVASNYLQQETVNYNGHGQSATGQQQVRVASSSSRTNYEGNELTRVSSRPYDQLYDEAGTESSDAITKPHHQFSKPVVVAEAKDKVQMKFDVYSSKDSTTSNAAKISRDGDTSAADSSTNYDMYSRDSRVRSYEMDDDSDTADTNDYVEYTERPKRVQKGRRRPYSSSSSTDSRRLPKEHRGSSDDNQEYDDHRKRPSPSRIKSNRPKTKGTWVDDDRNQGHRENLDERPYDVRPSGSAASETKNPRVPQPTRINKPSNTWSQISPNIEISHSSGIEIDEMEKPKFLLPVKVNLVPVANFDHTTALGNSQGFDISNAMLQNFAVSTSAPVLSPPQPPTGQPPQFPDFSKPVPNFSNIFSTAVPDIIIGQNSFQNPMHLVPHTNIQNKFSSNMKAQFLPSTVAPIIAVTSSINPGLQTIPMQSTIPRTNYVATPTPTTNLQQLTVNQMQSSVPQLIVPQPTMPTLAHFIPAQSTTGYNIQINPHGLQGQNLITHGNLQISNPASSSLVTSTPQPQSLQKVNLITAESQSRKQQFSGPGNFLASASLSVGHNDQKSPADSYYVQNPQTSQFINSQNGVFQVLKMPAILQTPSGLSSFNLNQQTILPDQQNMQGTNFLIHRSKDQNNNPQITAFNLDKNQFSKNKSPSLSYQSIDTIGSQSNSNTNVNVLPGSLAPDNAHLPNVGTRNVEIVNPNMKPQQVDTKIVNQYGNQYGNQFGNQYGNQYGTVHQQTAVVTTPIPIFSTTNFATARPAILSTTTSDAVNLQNFVDSLTEIGAKTNQGPPDLKSAQNQDRPAYNPINFVPNLDVIKNQNVLNSKTQGSEPLQQNLNLVPLLPGGNFFKPSFAAQSELLTKPKLSSDLEKYAEQMFRESLKTIYNSQRWNNDRKVGVINQNISDSSNDIARIKNELQRLKAAMLDSKRNQDIEAHHSESKIRTTEAGRVNSGNEKSKPDPALLATLEELLKAHPSEPIHIYHGGKPVHNFNRHNHGSNFKNDHKNVKHLRDFMTPPKPNSFISKSPFHDKSVKKRPNSGPRHHNQNARPHSRPSNLVSIPPGLEAAASNDYPVHVSPHRYGNYYNGLSFDRDSDYDVERSIPSDFKPSPPFDPYNSFSTSDTDDKDGLNNIMKNHNIQNSNGDIDINHPRMHNLLGLLMKNKQLPTRNAENYFRDKSQLKQFFEEEKQRLQQQFYDDTIRSFQKKIDPVTFANVRQNATNVRRVH